MPKYFKRDLKKMKISKKKAFSVLESFLFMSADPRPLSDLERLFEGEMSSLELKALLEEFQESYNRKERGVYLEQVKKGWQFRTKLENKSHLLKIRPRTIFRLSKPALEVLSLIAYSPACSKIEIEEIRGVESGHLLRTLIDKGLICFAGRSDLPGKPSLFKTTARFLEIFGLNSLKDLPSKEEIEELLSHKKEVEGGGLKAVSEEFDSLGLKIPHQRDEKENRRIKNIVERLPSTLEFLETKEGSIKLNKN